MLSTNRVTTRLLVNLYLVLIMLCSCFSINITTILKEYNSVCGDLLCNKHQIVRNIPNFSKDWKQCPDCSCDMSCVHSGNCCPDLFFSLRLTCVDITIVELPGLNYTETTSNNRYNTPAVLMINGCSLKSKLVDNIQCEQSEDTLAAIQNLPVTSNKTGLIYRNIYCLKCNNEITSDGISWGLRIKCRNDSSMVYFNYLSSYAEIIEMAKIEECSIAYVDIADFKHNPRNCKTENYQHRLEINTCNVSGTWHNYNPDVDVACQTYDNKYYVFRNIFCYICNPPPFNTINKYKISTCNVTGTWTPYNSDLEKACLETESNTITGKFRNVYCYLCNKNNYIFENTTNVKFKDASLKVTDSTLPYFQELEYPFMYNFQIKNVSLQKIITNSSSKEKSVYCMSNVTENNAGHLNKPQIVPLNNSDWIQSSNASFNVSMDTHMMLNVFKKYYAFTGIARFCNNYSTFANMADCSCDDFCRFGKSAFHSIHCCVDKLFEGKTTCTSAKYSKGGERYIVYNGCKNSAKESLKKLCHSSNHDIFSSLPVTLTATNFTVHYKNIFCYYCDKDPDEDEQEGMLFWDITLNCSIYIPVYYHFSFDQYIKFAQKNGCLVYIKPHHYIAECTKPKYTTCNITGNTRTENDDIRWACVHLNAISETENEFCTMCNPQEQREIIFSTCNKTGLWETHDKSVENNCLQMPEIEYHAPFKNIFCKICNNVKVIRLSVEMMSSQGSTNSVYSADVNEALDFFKPSYRSLFSIFSSEISDGYKIQEGICSSSQIYNKVEKRCLDLLCYPGRILLQNRCVPLLKETYNLGYIVSLELTANSSSGIKNTTSFLKAIHNKMNYFIMSELGTCTLFVKWTTPYNNAGSYIFDFFDSSFYLLKRSLESTDNESLISVLLNQKLVCLNKVNRSQIEEELLSLTRSEIQVYFSGEIYRFRISMNAEAFFLPKVLSSQQLSNNTFSFTRKTHDRFPFYAHVTELLRCKQVELNEYEYTIDSNTLDLTLKSNGIKISNIEYAITPSNKVRVCATHYQTLFEYKEENLSSLQYILGLLSMLCTCLSVLCLCITFISYLLFPILRTLPGKNNMALIAAMIFAHSLFQFGLHQTTSNICVYIGMLIHYFWLVKFLCLNVCSFHMFRVFRSLASMIHHHEASKQMKTFILYLLYSYGIPLVIVISNIIFTSTLGNKSGIGYGGNLCFLNQQISIIVTFLSPIMLCCLLNVFFFVLTTKNIASTLNKKEKQVESNSSEFSIYIKLFTITGISWIFRIIDSFLPSSPEKEIFVRIISFLNALQGVFVFVAYVCNKKVFKLYHQKFRLNRSKRKLTISSGTTSCDVERNSNKTLYIHEQNTFNKCHLP